MREVISRKEYMSILKQVGFSYLGNFSQSAKMVLNEKKNVITYCLYLAPWKLAGNGINTCPSGTHCHQLCLNASGHNKADILVNGMEGSTINRARIRKTRLFYDNRDLFMDLLRYEIEKTMRYAEKRDMGFSIRLNGTSDLSPELFHYKGEKKCILDMYPNVIFYDYTKVSTRLKLTEKYSNYYLTFSFDGFNHQECRVALQKYNVNVAVVFESEIMPVAFRGYPVCSGIESDLRYTDPRGHVVYLHYHRSAASYKNGKYERPDTPFIIREDDPQCVYAHHFPIIGEE